MNNQMSQEQLLRAQKAINEAYERVAQDEPQIRCACGCEFFEVVNVLKSVSVAKVAIELGKPIPGNYKQLMATPVYRCVECQAPLLVDSDGNILSNILKTDNDEKKEAVIRKIEE